MSISELSTYAEGTTIIVQKNCTNKIIVQLYKDGKHYHDQIVQYLYYKQKTKILFVQLYKDCKHYHDQITQQVRKGPGTEF